MKQFDWTGILDGSDSEESSPSTPKLKLGVGHSLGSPTPKSRGTPKCYLGFTLNYPRTVKFLNANSMQQKQLYLKWYKSFVNTFNIEPESELCFEFCKTGQIHAHGYIAIYIDKYYISGLVSDFTKSVLSHLPPKHNKFKENCLHTEYNRYRCPSIVIQYYTNDEKLEGPSGITHWKQYIKKTQ